MPTRPSVKPAYSKEKERAAILIFKFFVIIHTMIHSIGLWGVSLRYMLMQIRKVEKKKK
jgi:hypothetical protein